MTLTEAIDVLQRYKEVDKAAKQLWQDLDEAILRPRTELRAAPLPKIQIDGVSYIHTNTRPPLIIFRIAFGLANSLPIITSRPYSKSLKVLFASLSRILRRSSSNRFLMP